MLETLAGYRDAARQLSVTSVLESFDDDIPEEMQTALVRMAAAMSLDARMEKCEAFLSEETPEEITEAYYNAQEEIARVLDDAFDSMNTHIKNSGELEERIEALSVNTESAGLADDLLKLYKCEGIIRMAYRSAQKYPIYGPIDQVFHMEEDEDEAVTDQEKYIMDKMGVDICGLLNIRAGLIEAVQKAMGSDRP